MTGRRTRTLGRATLGLFVLGAIAASCDGRSSERGGGKGPGASGDAATAGIGLTTPAHGGSSSGRGGVGGVESGGGPGAGGKGGSGDGATAGQPEGGQSGEGAGGTGGEGSDCATGLTKCGDECVDLERNVRHCGVCNRVCLSNGMTPLCIDGGCASDPCPMDMADCHPEIPGCETPLWTFDDCGACGHSCARAHATAFCISHACSRVCEPGWDDCDSSSLNFDCETRLDTAEHCGSCDNVCPVANPLCSAGTCTSACAPPRSTQCGTRCVDTTTDSENCGVCGCACEEYQVCESGRCTPRYLGTGTIAAAEYQVMTVSARPDGSFVVLSSLGVPEDLDPGAGTDVRTPIGLYDAATSAFNPDGSYAWGRVIGGSDNETPGWIATAADGSIVETLGYRSSIDLDPGPATARHTSMAGSEAAVIKLSANGDFLWGKTFVVAGDQANGVRGPVALDALGNVFVAGSFTGTIDLDPGLGTAVRSAQSYTTFVVKLSPDGDYLWSIVFENCPSIGIAGIEVSPTGVVWLAATFGGTCDIDPGPSTTVVTATGDQDALAVRLDSGTGAIMSSLYTNGAGAESFHAIAFDEDGSVYLSGADYRGELPDALLYKTDAIGITAWVKVFSQMSLTFAAAPGGGAIGGGMGFRSTLHPQGVLAMKLDRDGERVWSIDLPGRNAGGYGLVTHPAGFVLFGGTLDSPIDLDPGAGTKLVSTSGLFISRYAL